MILSPDVELIESDKIPFLGLENKEDPGETSETTVKNDERMDNGMNIAKGNRAAPSRRVAWRLYLLLVHTLAYCPFLTLR